ncbi:MAG: GNAT family N-acetyltransferase [Bacillota bacterium]
MEIMEISKVEMPEAMGLVWEVFREFEAPDYAADGIRTFKEFIDCQAYHTTIKMFGAFENGTLLGVIATRNEGSHITLFFVRKEHHRQGVGRKLFEHIVSRFNNSSITVNSSPYAAEVYHKLGFIDLDTEQLTNGLRYIPMQYTR